MTTPINQQLTTIDEIVRIELGKTWAWIQLTDDQQINIDKAIKSAITEALAPVERKRDEAKKYAWNNMVCIHHNDIERAKCVGHCPVCAENKCDTLQALIKELETKLEKITESKRPFTFGNEIIARQVKIIDELTEKAKFTKVEERDKLEARLTLAMQIAQELADELTNHCFNEEYGFTIESKAITLWQEFLEKNK